MENSKTFLKSLISLPGLSGFEDPVRQVIAETWRPLVDDLTVSKIGSLHGLRKARISSEKPPRILLAAHMDAVGLMVTGLVDGYLRVTEIGGLDTRVLPSQPVIVHGRKPLPGVLFAPADRLMPASQSGKPAKLEHLLVDIGLLPEETAQWVRVGDIVSYATEPMELGDDWLAGHSMDNRTAVAAVTICLEQLQSVLQRWDVWAVATVQEEETLGGALTSPFEIRPDLAVVVDVTFAKGPGVSDYRGFGLGKGITLGWGPNIHPALFKAFKELADKLEIPYSLEPSPRMSGTDAMGVQVVAEGIPTIVIGIPLRYMHTPVEVVSMKDIQRAGRLMAQFIADLPADFMEKMIWEDQS